MDDKIKMILEKPEVPDILRPENIPLMIKEKRTQRNIRKIEFIKPLKVFAAAAACFAIVFGGLKILSGGDSIKKSASNDMCAPAFMNDTNKCQDAAMAENASDSAELCNPASLDALQDMLKDNDPAADSGMHPEGSLSYSNSESDDKYGDFSCSVFSDTALHILNSEKTICLEDDHTDASLSFEELFEGFSDENIMINDCIISEDSCYLIAELLKDSQVYSGVKQLYFASFDSSDSGFSYVQKGEWVNAFLSESDDLVLISDINVRAKDYKDFSPDYGVLPDSFEKINEKSVFFSSDLPDEKYSSLDFIMVSGINTVVPTLPVYCKSFVCNSPKIEFSDDDAPASMTIKSEKLKRDIFFDFKLGEFKLI